MTLSYELTLADFREAQISHSHSPTAKRPRRWLLYLVSFVMFYLLLSVVMPAIITTASASSGQQQQAGLLWLHFLLPFLVVGAMLTTIATVAILRSPGNRKRIIPGLIGWLLFILMLALLLVLRQNAVTITPSGTIQQSPPLDWSTIIYPHIGWLALMLFLTFFIIRSQIAAISRAWEKQSHLHTPHTADITAAGVVITTAAARHDYRWTAFPRHLESPNIFLLYLSDSMFQILPKRAFTTTEELEGFRNMAKNLIGKNPSDFEVVTTSS